MMSSTTFSDCCIDFNDFEELDSYPRLESANIDAIEEEIRSAMGEFALDDYTNDNINNKYNVAQIKESKEELKLSTQALSLIKDALSEHPKLECEDEEMLPSLIAEAIADTDRSTVVGKSSNKKEKIEELEKLEFFDFPHYRNLRAVVNKKSVLNKLKTKPEK